MSIRLKKKPGIYPQRWKSVCAGLLIIINISMGYASQSGNDSLEQAYNEIHRVSPEQYLSAGNQRYTITGEMPYETNNVSFRDAAIMTGLYAGVFVIQHQLQTNTIWKEKGDFKVMEDGQYALYSDKAGHIFGTYYTSYLLSESFTAIGCKPETAAILGSLGGLAYTTYVEILDGFGTNFGFSPSDYYANLGGFALHLGSYYFPVLQNFTPKFSYIPADWYGMKRRQPAFAFIDDYSSQTNWLSVNVNNLMPEAWEPYWPDFLKISLGYAARNLCIPNSGYDCTGSYPVSDEVWGNRKYIIALDYDLVKILPEMGAPWDWLIQSLNYFQLPSPAIEFGDRTRLFLLYPFVL